MVKNSQDILCHTEKKNISQSKKKTGQIDNQTYLFTWIVG